MGNRGIIEDSTYAKASVDEGERWNNKLMDFENE